MRRFHGVIAVEEQPTVDGRLVQRGALTWGDLPIPVLGNHPRFDALGRVDEIERHGNYILARGKVDDPRPVIPCGIDLTDIDCFAEWHMEEEHAAHSVMHIKRARIHAVTAYLEVDQLPAWPGVALLAITED